MPGTDPNESGPSDASTVAFLGRLTLAGWLFLTAEFGFILFQLERVRTVDGTRFATAWAQRVEVLGFMMLPPNLAVLAPATAVACAATLLAGDHRGVWLDALLRSVAAVAITMFFIGIASIAEIITRAGALELDAIFLRLGGMGLAAGSAVLCRAVDRR